jgi:hypothetical protein
MDELPLKAKTFLGQVRTAHEPPAGARERIRAQLAMAAIGGGSQPSGHRNIGSGGIGKLAKVGLATGLITIVGTTGYLLRRETKESASESARPNEEIARAEPQLESARRSAVPEPAALPAAVDAKSNTPEPVPPRARPFDASRRTAAVSSADQTLLAELSLLNAAADALSAQDLTRAHGLLETHRTRYPTGQLHAERKALAIVRDCLAGGADARARARSYLQAMPRSVLATRIERACGLESRPSSK